MGNRAVLEFTKNEAGNALYLHWEGPRECVEGILAAARELELPDNNEGHKALHAMVDGQIQSAYFEPLSCLQGGADGDNGTYLVENYRVIGRKDSYRSIDQLMNKIDVGYNEGERAERGHRYYISVMAHPVASARLAELKAQKEASDLNDMLPPAHDDAMNRPARRPSGAREPEQASPSRRPRL